MINLLLNILNFQAASKKSKANEIINSLDLRMGHVVVDIGSGGGYFAYKFSQKVGKDGRVYAIDVDTRYLNFIKAKAAAKGMDNIITMLTKGSDLELPPKSIDVIFMRDVFHDIDKPIPYFKRIYNALKSGGEVAIIDFINDGFSKESRFGHYTDEKVILKIMLECGFEHYKRFDFLSKQSFNLFKAK